MLSLFLITTTLLLSLQFVFAQNQQLALERISILTTTGVTSRLAIPQPEGSEVFVSVSLCTQAFPRPQFFVSAGTGEPEEEIILDGGLGVWNGVISSGAALVVRTTVAATSQFEAGLSRQAALHQLSVVPASVSDSASNSAIIFSPSYLDYTPPEPTYPNYTFPSAQNPFPPVDELLSWMVDNGFSNSSTLPNATLLVIPTTALTDTSLRKSRCAMQQLAVSVQATSNPTIASSVTIRSSGFHTQFVVSGLAASTNYTAWVAMSGNGVEMVSPPSYFATKSATYPCTLVHSLPYCPDVAYSIPLPPPAAAPFYTDANLPATLKSNLIGTIGNFTKSLGTFRCGHDLYSPITTCSECDRAYRKWACQVSLPRCSEASLIPLSPPPALILRTQSAPGRLLPAADGVTPVTEYTELLPCLETCHIVDRSCPTFLGWKCPRSGAPKPVLGLLDQQIPLGINHIVGGSYGAGYIDSLDGEALSERKGKPGFASDFFGNWWCNGV